MSSNSLVKPEIKEAYKLAFDHEWGAMVINDLKRIANGTRISADNPNQFGAVYKVAQLALIARITNMLGRTETD